MRETKIIEGRRERADPPFNFSRSLIDRGNNPHDEKTNVGVLGDLDEDLGDSSLSLDRCKENGKERENTSMKKLVVNELDFTKLTSPRDRKIGRSKTDQLSLSHTQTTHSRPVGQMTQEELIDIYNQKPIIPEYQSSDFEILPALQLEEEKRRVPGDEYVKTPYEYRTDMIDMLLRSNSNNCSALSQRGQIAARQGSLLIARTPDLVATIIHDTPDGILSDGFGHEQSTVLDYLSELNFISDTVGPQDSTPLFGSYQEAHEHFKKGRLADEIRCQYKFFLSCQSRDLDMRTIRLLLKGELSMQDDSVDIVRKTSRLAHVLIDDYDSLFLFQDLIFRLVFPVKGHKARALLVLSPPDLPKISQ